MKRIARQLIGGESYDPVKNYTGVDTSNPYVIYNGDTPVPSGYEDITTSLGNIKEFYDQAGADYITMRRMATDFVIDAGGFNSLDPLDMEISKEYIAIDETAPSEVSSIVGYILMSEIIPVDPLAPTPEEIQEATLLYPHYKSIQINKSSVAASERVYLDGAISPELLEIVMIHVNESEMKDLLDNVLSFLPDYTSISWFGVIYGDSAVGIADYINDSLNYSPDGGLWSFASNAPAGSPSVVVDAYKSARKTAFDDYLFR